MTANPTPPLSEAGLAAVDRASILGMLETEFTSRAWPVRDYADALVGWHVPADTWREIRGTLAVVLYAAMLSDREQAGRDALVAAADGVRDVRDNGAPEGCRSHPYAKHIEDWLRQRAGEPT